MKNKIQKNKKLKNQIVQILKFFQTYKQNHNQMLALIV